MKITLLGSGASAGVPLIGCECAVCRSPNPRNQRSRVSLLVETQGKKILIDTSPDLRTQCLREGISTVDAILYTHAHADHIHGIDDVRSLNFHRGAAIPAYMNEATLTEMQERFAYAFKEPPLPQKEPPTERPSSVPAQAGNEARSVGVAGGGISPLPKNNIGWFRPCLIPHTITPGVAFEVEGIEITPFRQHHGRIDSIGYRIGDMTYSTDVKSFPAESEPFLQGLKLWIVDCLKPEPAPTHAHLALSLEWIAKYKPSRAVLTHLAHELDYETLQASVPAGIEVGYDGMTCSL